MSDESNEKKCEESPESKKKSEKKKFKEYFDDIKKQNNNLSESINAVSVMLGSFIKKQEENAAKEQMERENQQRILQLQAEQDSNALSEINTELCSVLNSAGIIIQNRPDTSAFIKEGVQTLGRYFEALNLKLKSQAEDNQRIQNELDNSQSQLKEKSDLLENLQSELKLKDTEREEKTGEILSELDFIIPAGENKQESESDLWWEKIKGRLNRVKDLKENNAEMEKRLGELEEIIETRENSIAELNSLIENKNSEISGLKNTVSDRDSEISGLKNTVSDRDSVISGLKNTVSDRDSVISGLKNTVSERDSEISRLKNTVSERDSKINGLNDMISERDNEVSGLKNTVSERDIEINGLKNIVSGRDSEISKLNETIAEREHEIELLSEYKTAAEPYLKIYRLMVKCESMESAFDNIGIPMDTEITRANTIKFINAFSRQFDMARIIYNSMNKYKSENEQPLTNDERALINSINEFYKSDERFAEIDALDCLGMDGTNEVKFDRRTMIYLNDRKNTDIVHAQQIFVPLLRATNGKDIAGQAMIKGS